VKLLDDNIVIESFDWNILKPLGIVDKCMPSPQADRAICGKILAHSKDKVTLLRERIGVRVCIFKIGVTANPIARYKLYVDQGYATMWLIHKSNSLDLVHMLEAALISEYHQHVGCRNQTGTGGEGALNRRVPIAPPYFVYVVGARADQPRWVG